jgi:hypothetical protein
MSKTTSGRHSCARTAHGRGRHRRSRNASRSSLKVCEPVISHVHGTRRRTLHASGSARSYVTAGLTLVGASALIGSFIAPTPSNFDATRVQLASSQHDAPAPAQPLINLTDGGGFATDASPIQCRSGDTTTELFARIGTVANGVQSRRVGPDAFVAVAADVVSHIITAPKTGAALTNSALTSAVLDRTAELEASGAMPSSAAAAIRALVDTLASITSTSSDAAVAAIPPGAGDTVPGSGADAGVGADIGVGDALGGGGGVVPDLGTGDAVGSPATQASGPADLGGSSFFATPTMQFPTTATVSGGGGGGGALIGTASNVPGLPNADLTAMLMLWRDRFRDFPGTPGSPGLADFAALIALLHTHFPDLDLTDFFAHLRVGDVGDSLSDHGLADFFAHLRDRFGADLGSSGGMSDEDVAAFFAHLRDRFGADLGLSGMSDVDLKDFFEHLHVGFGGVGDSMSDHDLADLLVHLHDRFGAGLGSSGGMSDDDVAAFFARLHDKFGAGLGSSGGMSDGDFRDLFTRLHDGFGGVGDSMSDHDLTDVFAHLHDKFGDRLGLSGMSDHDLTDAFAHLHDKFGDLRDSSDARDHGLPEWGAIGVGDSIGDAFAGGHLVSEASRVDRQDDFHPSVEVDNNAPRHALPDSSEADQQDQHPNNPEPSLDVGLQRGPLNAPRDAISESPRVGYTPKHSRETQTGDSQLSQNQSTGGSTGGSSQPRHAKPSQSESNPASANRHVSNSSAGSTGHRKGG